MILDTISRLLVLVGVGWLIIGSIGVNRLPDFFSRSHASSKPDTLGLILCMVGLSIHEGLNLNTAKLLLIVVFVFLANPAAIHALGRAAIDTGLVPWMRADRERR